MAVLLCRFPYPYRCALAICTDLDETLHARAYDQLLRFLNTNQETDFGRGVELECANSIYFDMPAAQFSYWNADEAGRRMVRDYIHSGHVDVLHSYGDLAHTRASAQRALEELQRHDCKLTVWVDHSKAPTNFGPDIMRGEGDVPGASAYHADLSVAQGIRFVWRGRVTSVIGQDIRHTTRGLFRWSRPWVSTRTVLKERAKHRLGRRGNEKYAMHADNRLWRPIRLRDGSAVIEFMRFNPHPRGVEFADAAADFGECISSAVLDRLVEREAAAVLYAHLGKFYVPGRGGWERAVAALRALAGRFHDEQVLVTTTSRLLQYVVTRDAVRFDAHRRGESVILTIRAICDPLDGERAPRSPELHGLTFALPAGARPEIRLADGSVVPCTIHHRGEHTYAAVAWPRLRFPQL